MNYGQGSGFIGLPGDFTSPSRFVRASLFSQWAKPGKTAQETVNLGFHILNTFDIFDGDIKTNTANQMENTKGFLKTTGEAQFVSTDTTEWIVAHDRPHLKTYVQTYGGLEIQLIDLRQAGFEKPGRSGSKPTDGCRRGDMADMPDRSGGFGRSRGDDGSASCRCCSAARSRHESVFPARVRLPTLPR